jgi:uncharacterized protein (TIGR03000 family)
LREGESMLRLLAKGVGVGLGLLAVLGVSLPAAVAADVHDDGGLVINRQHIPQKWRPFYGTPSKSHSPQPILFHYYYPTSAARSTQAFAGHRSRPAVTGGLYGVPRSELPWKRPGFQDYNEPASPRRSGELDLPGKYQLRQTEVTHAVPKAPRNVAVIVAHLPPQSPLWVEGKRTAASGSVRSFASPPLTPGKKYLYTVRTVWFENGKWVGQTLEVPVEAGEMTAIYLDRAATTVANSDKTD